MTAAPVRALGGLAAVLLVGAGLAACGEALDALSLAMAGTMADAADRGIAPAALARTWFTDPALHAAVGQLSFAVSAWLLPPMLAFALLALV